MHPQTQDTQVSFSMYPHSQLVIKDVFRINMPQYSIIKLLLDLLLSEADLALFWIHHLNLLKLSQAIT